MTSRILRIPLPSRRLRAFAADESGATAIEYAVIGTFLSIAALAGVDAIGAGLLNLINLVAAEF